MVECMFCRIVSGEIPADIVYRSSSVIGFRDIHPQAPVHVLLVPTRHIPSIIDVNACDEALFTEIQKSVCKLSSELHLENGFRVVVNHGPDGGQTVSHLHFHLLGKRQMSWPPG
ncbi:MAG: HIT domain-containing protein [Candidatus Riflebacteria bacterium]|nr:HIT domain-containing protein [Candidatus Riflebacteria bacterium]